MSPRAREASVADRLLWASWSFWQIRGYLCEGRRLADATLALPATDARLRCRAYEAAGGIAYWKAEFEDCFKWYTAALELARQIGDPDLVADALHNSGFGMAFPPEADPIAVAAAEAMSVEAHQIYRGLGDRVGEARVSLAQATLVWSLPDHSSLARAVDFYRESADTFQAVGDVLQ